ncbi:RidA family protein [Reinekea sp.]|jgi:reactive intermediate/imine deaminase|uniref:RidA family protein n=1 Tax=Reinekea sp. TaxID=1970455 RepID=UPI002A8379B3|nr:RidA family protein [Reinekea sp.]
MSKEFIKTDLAPAAIGTYSQAVKVGQTVYLSGQIPLDPVSMTVLDDAMAAQIHQVFKNLSAVCAAAGGSMNELVKVNIFLIDLGHFALVNEIMATYFNPPYPARAAVQVSALPKGVAVEIDGVLVLS